jgi:hypothetical protein
VENVMMKGARLKAIATMIVGAMVASAPRLANACATCGLSDGSPAFQAYKTSALFMVAAPYASFAVIGGITYLFYRRSQRQDRKSITK